MNDAALIQLDNARTALAECKTVMEAKKISDVAEAARVYLERTNASTQTVNRAAEIRTLAERQMGEFLQQMPMNPGVLRKGSVVPEENHGEPTLAEIGIGFWTVLVEGVDEELFRTIDAGKSRSLPDVLTISGEKSVTHLAASLNRLAEYLRDARGVAAKTGAAVTFGEAMDVLAACPGIRDSVTACKSEKIHQVISASRIAWLHYLTEENCPQASAAFFEKLATGEMLSVTSPIYLLRARLVADHQAKARLSTREVLALVIKAWNMHVENKTVKQLKWSEDEPFPILNLPESKTAVA